MKHIKSLLTLLLFLFFSTSLFGASTNVAPLGTATQVSNFRSNTIASRGNDNNTNGAYPNLALTRGATAYDWWYLDLGAQYPIKSINIFLRTGCPSCKKRLRNVRVMVSDTPFVTGTTSASHANAQTNADWAGQFPSNFNSSTKNFPSVNTSGRYVLIQKSGANTTNYLTLAEVQVFVDNSTTVWVPNGTSTSATTLPQPYTNNADDSETLTIAGATHLQVTITGTLEFQATCGYDYVTITPNAGINKYCGGINDTFIIVGNSVSLNFHSDTNVVNTGVTVSIVSYTPNNPPTFTSTAPPTVNDNVNYTYTPSTNDPDGDPVTITATTLPAWLSFNGVTLSGVPGVANVGNHTVTLSATDGNGGTVTQSFTITVVLTSNVAPLFTSTPILTIAPTIPYSYTVTTSDANGDIVTVTATTIPSWLSFDGTTLIGTPTAANIGPHTIILTADDGNGGTTTQNFIIIVQSASLTANNPRTFTKVSVAGSANTNIAGDLLVIGNQSLCWTNGTTTCQQPPFNGSNNGYNQNHINLDASAASAGYINSTSADLALGPDDTVLEAWLYWIGRINNNSTTLRASADHISLKTPTTTGYVNLTSAPEKFNWMVDGSIFDYGAAVNVTQYVQQGGKYWVADLQATAMSNQGSGWALAVIVRNTAFPRKRSVKNISLYDGFNGVFNSAPYPSTVSSTISGFLTPIAGTVKSNLIVFAGESDRGLNDSMSLTRRDGTAIALKDSLNDTNNIQNGTISKNGINVTSRNPNFENTLGIDIDELNVSNIIENNQTSTIIRIDSNNDRIFLAMYGFATQLYVPEVCYDYTVQNNGFDITEDNRAVDSKSTDNLSINIALQNLEADFDLRNSSLAISFIPSSGTSFDNALYAPNNVNTLIPAIHVSGSSSTYPQIAIGENASSTGGTIRRNQLYFAEFNYNLPSSYVGKFEIDFNTTIDFGSGAVPTLLSTRTNTIPRCPQSTYYNPREGNFNVERVGSSGIPSNKFPLYTQIVGKDFDFEVVAYDGNTTPPFTTEIALQDYTVDLELINASTFSDDNATFLCSNPNPKIIKNLAPNINNLFVLYPPTSGLGTSRVDLSSVNIITDTALRSAVFRMWYIVDQNNTILQHHCASPSDNTCFQALYDNNIRANDNSIQQDGTIGFCQSCTSYSNPLTGKSGCYACLRDFFAKPVCSRDNFSIRPESYRLNITDTNESLSPLQSILLSTNNTNTNLATLAAEYGYYLEGNATVFNSNIAALNYNINFDTILKYNTSSGVCTDTSDKNISLIFENGQILTNVDINHSNVGNYNLQIRETEWTKVDQNNALFGTYDCIQNSGLTALSTTGKSGCNTVSNLNTFNNTKNYYDLALTFQPYKFDVSTINSILPNNNNFIYVNQLNVADPVQLAMSVGFEGNITALGKAGTILSNYTNSCASENLFFDINRSIERAGVAIDESSLLSIDLESMIPVNTPLHLQRLYEDKDSIPYYAIEDNITNDTTMLSFSKTQFIDAQNGSAKIKLYYNVERFSNKVMNPINITFLSKEANSTDASSVAHFKTHIPKGISPTGLATLDFFYARAAPSQDTPYLIDRSDNIATIPMYIEVYCESLDLDCSQYNLAQKSIIDPNTWWVNGNHISLNVNGDGNMLAISDRAGSSPLTINPNTNVYFNNSAGDDNKTDISVTISSSILRPYNTTLNIVTPFWIGYNPDDSLSPILHFLGGGGWAGKGNTGNIVNTNPYYDDQNKRSEW